MDVVRAPERRLSGWELREKMKHNPVGNAREEFTLSQRTLSTSSLHPSEDDDHCELPPAFRTIVAGQKIKRGTLVKNVGKERLNRGSNHSTTGEGGQPAAGITEMAATKHVISPEKSEPVKDEGKESKEKKVKDKKAKDVEKVKVVKKKRKDSAETKRTTDKSDAIKPDIVTGSTTPMWKQGKSPSPQRPEKSRKERNNSDILKRNPYAPTSHESTDDASVNSLSLDSLPPPEREERVARSCPDKCSLNPMGRSFSSFGECMDLSGHRMFPENEQITTSASDEQWARFKLLGRLGLGEITLSKEARALVDRNYSIMLNAIKHIYALRDEEQCDASVESMHETDVLDIKTGKLLEEVQETIRVPTEGPAQLKRDPNTIVVDPKVEKQLKDYMTVISCMYRDNPFHNYEHASTVLKAVHKVIGCVGHPDDDVDFRNLKHGYGVAREPWNHFALVFAALIHDVDHNGVPNAQLIKERSHVAGAYKNRSVAEQNSIELAWNLLMEPCYKELREFIFHHRSEVTNFRSLVVTAVMATDIADKELAALRKGRAQDALKAEDDDQVAAHANMDLVRRKATFVVETLIQVADVSHTMSSFATFKKWNHRLYKEMYKAFKNGRAECDPTESWYRGEFGFFDFYIIPLAKKLNECGISVEASEIYLRNAVENRRLWEEQGEKLVEKYVAERDTEDAAREECKVNDRKSRIIPLRDFVLDDWSSSSDSGTEKDFAEGTDDDSVSISSDEAGRVKRTHPRVPSVALMERTMPLATVGRVPSKASLEIKKARRAVMRSKSMELTDRVRSNRGNEERSGMRIRMRSQSPSSESSKIHIGSNGSLPDDALRLRPRSRSPGSASEGTGPRSILKTGDRSRSMSPASKKEMVNAVTAQATKPEGNSARNVSPSSLPQLRPSKAGGKVVRRVRRLSSSPGSGSECSSSASGSIHADKASIGEESPRNQELESNKSSTANSNGSRGREVSRIQSSTTNRDKKKDRKSRHSKKIVRRGRRPSRSRSPGSSVENGTEERKSDVDLKRGKRPSLVSSKS